MTKVRIRVKLTFGVNIGKLDYIYAHFEVRSFGLGLLELPSIGPSVYRVVIANQQITPGFCIGQERFGNIVVRYLVSDHP